MPKLTDQPELLTESSPDDVVLVDDISGAVSNKLQVKNIGKYVLYKSALYGASNQALALPLDGTLQALSVYASASGVHANATTGIMTMTNTLLMEVNLRVEITLPTPTATATKYGLTLRHVNPIGPVVTDHIIDELDVADVSVTKVVLKGRAMIPVNANETLLMMISSTGVGITVNVDDSVFTTEAF